MLFRSYVSQDQLALSEEIESENLDKLIPSLATQKQNNELLIAQGWLCQIQLF